ncbi:hypothetical protein [Sessilibacter sp. MAH2]
MTHMDRLLDSVKTPDKRSHLDAVHKSAGQSGRQFYKNSTKLLRIWRPL